MKTENRIKNSAGFTLTELLLVIAITGLAAGITVDIVMTLVRAFSKTQITNEIEQNANFVSQKIEKELRNASAVTEPSTLNSASTTMGFRDRSGNLICYRIMGSAGAQYMQRAFAGLTGTTCASAIGYVDITSNDAIRGLSVSGTGFTLISQSPQAIRINLIFSQVNSPSRIFTGNVSIDTTLVIRGSYK